LSSWETDNFERQSCATEQIGGFSSFIYLYMWRSISYWFSLS